MCVIIFDNSDNHLHESLSFSSKWRGCGNSLSSDHRVRLMMDYMYHFFLWVWTLNDITSILALKSNRWMPQHEQQRLPSHLYAWNRSRRGWHLQILLFIHFLERRSEELSWGRSRRRFRIKKRNSCFAWTLREGVSWVNGPNRMVHLQNCSSHRRLDWLFLFSPSTLTITSVSIRINYWSTFHIQTDTFTNAEPWSVGLRIWTNLNWKN